ncbi:MAG TPA: hypothetical protein VHG28_19150 [Longimicrobiaceae bacterium]|nr:hypothetical protein [Longimicrobiaceae bacterium]
MSPADPPREPLSGPDDVPRLRESHPPRTDPPAEVPGALEPPVEIDAAQFRAATGEDITRVLSLDTWHQGPDLAGVYERLEREVAEAVAQEDEFRDRIRETVFPVIGSGRTAPPCAGVYEATEADIRMVHEKALFNGGVEACDGTVAVHDTLPLTVAQVGVALVSYAGEQGSWVQRIYHRDVRDRGRNPIEGMLEVLGRRERRAGLGRTRQADAMSELLSRGLMTYSERAALLERSHAPWRMGHGQPVPYELITGSGSMDLLRESIGVLRELLLGYRRWVFVPSEPRERMLLTLGDALLPREFAIIDTMEARMHDVIEKGHLRGEDRERAWKFYHDAAPRIVIGVYRASKDVPPYVFYAHVDHAEDAALIAMADSVLQAHRGFPVLIDIADSVCASAFGAGGFQATVESAYAARGRPFSYLRERETRE